MPEAAYADDTNKSVGPKSTIVEVHCPHRKIFDKTAHSLVRIADLCNMFVNRT
jgi:hypothetical protein